MKQLVKGLSEKRTPQGICVMTCHYTADPERAKPEWAERERKKYTSDGAWQREQEINFSAGGGERLFAEILNRYGDKIIVDPETSKFRPSPHWDRLGGGDYGKANPMAVLLATVDYDGTIWILREYYQPGFTPKQHAPWVVQLEGFTSTDYIYCDPSMFYETQAQADGTFKAQAGLFAEEGITNLVPAPENNELLGMERILAHWMNLDERAPSLRIICPKRLQDIAKPMYGICNVGCPNLLWELRRARRAELTPTQLVNKNPTEKIVDKDNHLRDALKYLCLTLPDPTRKTAEMIARERVKPLIDAGDLTSAMIRYDQQLGLQENQAKPAYFASRKRR
jgi:hypothetical protein